MQATPRFDYMDNLRALAMLSGVVFHAALAYSPLLHPFFPTSDRAQSAAVDIGIWFLHLFRMPLFFVVAGFFACMLVQRRGLAGFLVNRLKRIALPFVIFWPLVYLALSWSTLHAAATVQHPSPMLVMIQQYLQMEDAPTPPPGTGHLWFLYYLMLFYVLIWSLRSLGLQRLGDYLRRLGPIWHLGLLPLCLVPALATVSAPHPAPESLLPQFWAIGFYGPFFAFGYLLFGQQDWLMRAQRMAPWLLLASLLLYAAFLHLLAEQTYNAEDPSAPLPIALLEAYISVWMTVVCLVAGRALLNRSNRLLRYLADASYWTYIIHLPILFALQYALMDLSWPWGLKFSVSLIVTLSICLISYPLIVRGRFLTGLLGSRAPVASPATG